MNLLNYGSLKASKRLVDAGIVLETDFYWILYPTEAGYLLGDKSSVLLSIKHYPAPSMAEAWRELPRTFNEANPELWKVSYITYCAYCDGNLQLMEHSISNTNPTDALIDLLIWARKEAKLSVNF